MRLRWLCLLLFFLPAWGSPFAQWDDARPKHELESIQNFMVRCTEIVHRASER
jgi:hypothetical protein